MWQIIMWPSSMRPMVCVIDMDVEFDERCELAAVSAAKTNRVAADGVGFFDSTNHVRGVSAAAQHHHDISGPGEILQLFDKDRVITHIIGVRGQSRDLLAKRHDPEALRMPVAGALHHVASEVVRCSGAPPIATDEDLSALLARLGENVNSLLHLVEINRLQSVKKLGLVFAGKNS